MSDNSPEHGITEHRITELQIQLAHVSRLYEQLNEVVTEQALRADRMQRQFKHLTDELKSLKAKTSEPATDPLDEKPPHY